LTCSSQWSADRNRGEAQSDDLESRGPLRAGRAGYRYGFAALNLGLQTVRDGKGGEHDDTLA